jgi:hypothetical protein
MSKRLTDNERAERAAARLKVREQKFTRKRWVEMEREFFEAIQMMRVFLGSGAAVVWRENAPPHLRKVKPLIDEIYRSMRRASGGWQRRT